jgi:hypothetical protein
LTGKVDPTVSKSEIDLGLDYSSDKFKGKGTFNVGKYITEVTGSYLINDTIAAGLQVKHDPSNGANQIVTSDFGV